MIEQNKTERKLVSVIMPAYNCEDYIGAALDSIINQSYRELEIIIIDDCSNDSTAEIVKEYKKEDNRIKYKKLNENSGAAIARNSALDIAKGTYIAFLDSDDIWLPGKLTKQISFMEQNKYDFTCTNYSKINEKGFDLNKIIKTKLKNNYNDILKNCPGNSTIIYNAKKLGKVKIIDIKKRNDYVMWLEVIKRAKYLYSLDEVLSNHRIGLNSVSSKKIPLIKYHWFVYRTVENLSLVKSISLIFYWSTKGLKNIIK